MAEFWDGKIVLVLPWDPSYALRKVSTSCLQSVGPQNPTHLQKTSCPGRSDQLYLEHSRDTGGLAEDEDGGRQGLGHVFQLEQLN